MRPPLSIPVSVTKTLLRRGRDADKYGQFSKFPITSMCTSILCLLLLVVVVCLLLLPLLLLYDRGGPPARRPYIYVYMYSILLYYEYDICLYEYSTVSFQDFVFVFAA